MMSSANTSFSGRSILGDDDRRSTIIWSAAVVCIVGGHLAVMLNYFEPAIWRPDASGYFGQARLIASTGHSWFRPESSAEYIPPNWVTVEDGRVFSKYPPGLPLLAAALYRLGGLKAALLINPVMASLTLLGLILLCRRLIGPWWALVAALILAVNPIANTQAQWAFSHTAVSFFLVFGLYILMRWPDSRSLPPALLAGAMLGVVPTIRYAEVLIVAGVAVIVCLRAWTDRRSRRTAWAVGVGAGIPIAALLVFNRVSFGAFLSTGYSTTGEQSAFSAACFVRHGQQVIEALTLDGFGPLLAFGIIGIAMMCCKKENRRLGLALVCLIVPSTLLYIAYCFPVDGMDMRFFVPLFPLYSIATVWVLQVLSSNRWRHGVALASLALLIQFAWGLPVSLGSLRSHSYALRRLVELTDVMEDRVPPGSIVVADKLVSMQLHLKGSWRLADENGFFADKSNNTRLTAAARDIWRWADGIREVYIVTTRQSMQRFERRLPSQDQLVILETLAPQNLPGTRVVKKPNSAPSLWLEDRVSSVVLAKWLRTKRGS
ncbi:MAG: hypothetical protein GY854_13150 [Deltaproteobacteria bacterium]|nr:hypothetical protein [Deltaproteobacteria bacterium]